MQIIVHDTNELSELDIRVLKALVGSESSAPTTANKASSKVDAEPEKAAPKPAKKAAAAKPKPEPEPEPEEAEEEPEAEEDEDLVGDSGPTMADAVALATKLVSEGRAVEVKSTLAECGAAKRVSELSGDNIAKFVNAFA